MSYVDFNSFDFNTLVLPLTISSILAIGLSIIYAIHRKRKNREKLAVAKKVKVIIRQSPRDEEKLIEPELTSDGLRKFVMEPPKDKKGKAGWSFIAPEGSIRLDTKGRAYLEVFRGAAKAIVFNYDVKSSDQPHWNKDESKRFITAEALTRRYAKQAQELSSLKTWVIVTLIICVVAVCIGLFNSYMINKIPIITTPAPSG